VSALNEWQQAKQKEFAGFVARNVAPSAEGWDREQRIPAHVIAQVARAGYLGAQLPREHGGQGWDLVTFGLLHEAFGRGSSALTGVLTVQSMVCAALLKWGTAEQKRAWLAPLAKGRIVGAFALTEPGAGSTLRKLEAKLERASDRFVLNGTKKWISCAQFASVFLVFAKLGAQPVACLVPRESGGLRIEPITELMGFRAAGLAALSFEDVTVAAENLVGAPGFGLSHVAPVGLQQGRLSTACSALGLLRGCFEESTAYAAARRIGDATAGDLGMVRSLIARMGVDLEAASALCLDACRAADERLPQAMEKALIAKHFTSRAAVRAASDAVQIRGASGCHASSPVSRYYRDAKIMEIIEGTTQVHEDLLGALFVDRAARASVAAHCGPSDHERTPARPRLPSRSGEDRRVQSH
jgi:alkylation response protein AidB-like acyl-CoA dehydrogenase